MLLQHNRATLIAGLLGVMSGLPISVSAEGLCPTDFNGDLVVDPIDLATLLGAWGPCPEPCEPETCVPDVDGSCVVDPIDLATLLGAWGPCPVLNDDCETRIVITDGDTSFDMSKATTGGPAHDGCGFVVGLPRLDVWFEYTATCSGMLCVSTCDQAVFDTTLAIYDACECPATEEMFAACNDDRTDCVISGTSRALAPAVLDACYMLRVGSRYDNPPFFDGTLTVTCLEGVTSDCCLDHEPADGPGCDDALCETFICLFDPFCCDKDVFWDIQCTDEALALCDVCDGGC